MKSWSELSKEWSDLLDKARHTDRLFRANALISGCIKLDKTLVALPGVNSDGTLDQRIQSAESLITCQSEL